MNIEDSLESIAASLAILAGRAPAAPESARKEDSGPEPRGPLGDNKDAEAEAEAEKKAAATAKRKEAAAKKKAAEAATAAATAPDDAPAVSEVPDPCTREHVRDKLTVVTEELGREVVVALFQRLGVQNLKGLDESDYGKAWALGDRAIKEGAEVITGAANG